jgi:hypothetical protein
VRASLVIFITVAVTGCAAKRLPPGTPPPEYELRELPPWTPPAPDAGAPEPPAPLLAPAPVPEPADAGTPSEAPSEVPPDAGGATDGAFPDGGVR